MTTAIGPLAQAPLRIGPATAVVVCILEELVHRSKRSRVSIRYRDIGVGIGVGVGVGVRVRVRICIAIRASCINHGGVGDFSTRNAGGEQWEHGGSIPRGFF